MRSSIRLTCTFKEWVMTCQESGWAFSYNKDKNAHTYQNTLKRVEAVSRWELPRTSTAWLMIPKEVWTIVGMRICGSLGQFRGSGFRSGSGFLGLFLLFHLFFFSLPLLFSFLKYISRSSFHFLTDAVCYYFLRFQRHCQVFLDDFSEMKASGFSEKLTVCKISLFWGIFVNSLEFKTLLQDSWWFSNSSDKIP